MIEERVRRSARVLLVDPADRILLFSVTDDGATRWFAPGGGLVDGETYPEAAARELWEETGLTVDPADLGPEVWHGRPWASVREGVPYRNFQHYFLLRAPAFEIDTSRFEALERAAIDGHRWWTVPQLRSTTDCLRPAGLPDLLSDLLSGGAPAQPVLVSG
ncbi:NUDIX hydrolase [Microlunatus parietis]|uniref:8-oxo-dGTP pyrophosphatase MutT (NUDIX family) n=1 Tax=Microlunatus parietis TaxID=682979 RepID=A0A7Y9LAT2_9ACTN|nr:NUDIX domain-containing protein [Microlunatus parietis]NYE71012.1 8-oxo-dGTP pyrophosphatase MutT (NUDIX family) [Microlunatus parietis]